MDIILKKPTEEYANDIMKIRQELFEANDGDSFAGCGILEKCTTAKEWIDYIKKMENQETCPEGFVPSNSYIAVRKTDNKIVGIIDLRHNLNAPILSEWGGHMGYIVRPCERGKGYAKEMLRLNLENARKLGLEKVMVTCKDWNVASEKSILANGGVYERDSFAEGSVIKRYWIEL